MLIKLIREQGERFDASLKKRGAEAISAKVLALDVKLRKKQQEMQDLQSQRNNLAKDIGKLMWQEMQELQSPRNNLAKEIGKSKGQEMQSQRNNLAKEIGKSKGQDNSELIKQSDGLKHKCISLEAEVEALRSEIMVLLNYLPNILADEVPEGKTEEDNIQIKLVGEKPQFSFQPREHFELGEKLGQMDFEQAAYMSGSRFVLLRKDLARLERALTNFMLDIHTTEFGYEEFYVPTLVKDHAMFGTGQLPKLGEDSFAVEGGYRLIPTAEVSLTNIVANKILPEEELPLRFTAYSQCYRSEAGSAGRDTRGMIRQHQFSKIELVSIVHPRDAETEHERMLAAAEEVLKRLGLHYRVMLLCAGDTGFSAQKTYDIEVWLPGQGKYREISSCSNCGQFQAERMKARYKSFETGKNDYVYTLNGSGLPVGRTIVAILENYQQEDGSIAIPEKLVPYMNGKTKISVS
jgi:seryl-tRNA synthetase